MKPERLARFLVLVFALGAGAAALAFRFWSSSGVVEVHAAMPDRGGWLTSDLQARVGEPLHLRRPDATRPFQHVLDVLTGYLLHAEDLCRKPRSTPAALNFGPDGPPLRVAEVVAAYGEAAGQRVLWLPAQRQALPEAQKLALDSSLARSTLGWVPRHDPAGAVAETARWHAAWRAGADMAAFSRRSVREALTQ